MGTMLNAYQRASGRGGERWYLGILPGRHINAYAGRGGWFYVTEGFLRLRRPFQAALLAHEASHHIKGHIGTHTLNIGAIRGNVALGEINIAKKKILGGTPPGDTPPGGAPPGGANAKKNPAASMRAEAQAEAFNAFSRAQEFEADHLAACLMHQLTKGRKNFGARNLRHFFEYLSKRGIGDESPLHPQPKERAARLGRIISGELAPCPKGWKKSRSY
ncbi:MAG: hypothetical protein HN400_13935 [Nitrospinaceae bacterium]|nr:hypothetical protein [Nitrospinaceae bacterium]